MSRSMSVRAALIAAALATWSCADHGAPPPEADGEDRDHAVVSTFVLSVDEVTAGASSLRALAARHHGYVRSSVLAGEDPSSARFELRVPAGELDAFRRGVRTLGDVEAETEEVRDVTEQRADLAARLRSARVAEERLLALLSERAESLADVVAIEDRLAQVRERIEQLEANERGLRDRVELATVRVELHARGTPFWHDPAAAISAAGRRGLELACALGVGAAALAAGAAPIVLLFALGLVALALFARALRFGWRRTRA